MYNPSAALLDGPMDTYPPPPVSQDPYQAHQDIQEAYPPPPVSQATLVTNAGAGALKV